MFPLILLLLCCRSISHPSPCNQVNGAGLLQGLFARALNRGKKPSKLWDYLENGLNQPLIDPRQDIREVGGIELGSFKSFEVGPVKLGQSKLVCTLVNLCIRFHLPRQGVCVALA